MRYDLHRILHQDDYKGYNRDVAGWLKSVYKKSLSTGDQTKLDSFKDVGQLRWDFATGFKKSSEQERDREEMAKSLIAGMFNDITKPNMLNKAGVSTTLGYNFYDLRAPVALLYPVNTPIRNSLPRVSRVNDGWGTAAHWMATRNPGYGVFAGAAEGQRNAFSTPDNNQYMAAYKELGMEREVTFTAQFAGEGFADNLADEHLRGLHTIMLQEEGIMLNGNSGAAGTGFKLGTALTPTTAVTATHTVGVNGNTGTPGLADLPYTTAITTSNYVSVAVVFLTAQGNPANAQYGYGNLPTVASGLTPTYTRTNADGTTSVISGGTSAISVLSNVTQATTNNLTIKATLPAASLPVKGCYGYAWYVDVETSNTGSLANAKLAGITTTPFAYISGTPTGTQTGTFTGINVDNSYNSLEFDGLLTYCASTPGAYYVDLQGGTLTSQKNGRVTEVETALQTLFNQYQTPIDRIWGSPDAITCLDSAIRYSGTASTGYQFMYTRDSQNNLLGGFVVSAYQSRYAVANPLGAQAIPILIHPMVPPGTLYLEIANNPYPHGRVKNVREMMVQRDYYSIEWPIVTRQWAFGTYVHEVLAHYMPWTTAVITGIGPFVGS